MGYSRRAGHKVILPIVLAVLTTLPALVPAAARAALSPQAYAVSDLCSTPAPGHVGCFGLKLVKRATLAAMSARPSTTDKRASAAPSTQGSSSSRAPAVTNPHPEFGSLSPLKLATAYSLPSTPASPQTIAIVDAYDDPTAASDLAVYDHQFFADEAEFPGGPPACQLSNGVVADPAGGPSEDGCFLKVNQRGETATGALPEAETGWDGEIATDIEIAHGVCRSCRIVLVEAFSSMNREMNIAENEAATLGANEISDSWGGPESSAAELPAKERAAFEHPGTVITVASGDNGYLDWDLPKAAERGHVNFPASSPDVVAVGGTRLKLAAGGSRQSETVWNGSGASGGGCSTVFTAQLWQQNTAGFSGVGCPSSHRAVADVSAVADPYTGIAVYNSQEDELGETGWGTIGGTSVAAPVIASIFALAGGADGVPFPAKTLYQHRASTPGSLYDVVEGSNGRCTEPFVEKGPELGASGCAASTEAAQCSSQGICLASAGYDGPSGVGAPNGIAAFQITGSGEEPEPEPEPEEGELEEIEAKGGSGGPPAQGLPVSANPLAGAASPFSGPLTPTGIVSVATPRLSHLALTSTAIAALHHRHPSASRIVFSFTLSIAAKVRVTLARRAKIHGLPYWRPLSGSITVSARAGHDRARLKGARALSPGRYRLTLTPTHGASGSITIVVA